MKTAFYIVAGAAIAYGLYWLWKSGTFAKLMPAAGATAGASKGVPPSGMATPTAITPAVLGTGLDMGGMSIPRAPTVSSDGHVTIRY